MWKGSIQAVQDSQFCCAPELTGVFAFDHSASALVESTVDYGRVSGGAGLLACLFFYGFFAEKKLAYFRILCK